MVVDAMEREDEQQLRGEEEEEDKALRANEANKVCAYKER
jgi:hypothetical protein